MFFNSWSSLFRVVAVGVPAYIALVVLLRISGKRTLSKLNAFDLIVTITFGSSLSAALLNPDLALADVVAAFGVLVTLQFLITWTSVRAPIASRLVKSEPRLLFHRGRFIDTSLHRERLTRGEVLAAIRSNGHADIDAIHAVVIETDGTLSVMAQGGDSPSALAGVRGFRPNDSDARESLHGH
jgi:uncharacterized membrane protein YcaP (DUF421 family)